MSWFSPLSLDKPIIQGGDWAQRVVDGAAWFQAPGTINGTQGMYQIGVNSTGLIYLKPPSGGIGHIDLYNKGATGSGYYYATEVWFWPIK